MNIRTLTLALILPLLLAACAAPPSRYAGGGYDGRYGGYSRCADCGVVEQIDRVDGERRSDGTGAVLGGIIGGVLGNQVGSGDGRRAATVAGAIATGTCELCSNRSTFDDTLTWPSGPSWPEPTTINAASRRLASSRIAAGTERAVTQMADDCTSG